VDSEHYDLLIAAAFNGGGIARMPPGAA